LRLAQQALKALKVLLVALRDPREPKETKDQWAALELKALKVQQVPRAQTAL
jgi:hypothetical protein